MNLNYGYSRREQFPFAIVKVSIVKELNKNILNIQNSYLSDKDEYSFTVGTGKNTKNVILKLDIAPEDDISNETIAKGLVQYISAFEEISAWQR